MSATPASMPMSTNMSTPIFVVAREPDAGGFAAVPLSLLAASPSQSPALAPLPHARTPAPAPFALCPAAPTPRSAAAAYSSAAIPQHGHLHHPAPPATLMSQPSDISVTDAPPSFLVRLSSIISDTSFE
ncbi:hypothetical protein HK105_206724 [Polyrhizophydium stewartii]|uniref:Uncharacterized protein n=1 Tax=Polyrhizophydium stewartii TaxID=2732419 RepID=A0ABR4N2H8_9FUNG